MDTWFWFALPVVALLSVGGGLLMRRAGWGRSQLTAYDRSSPSSGFCHPGDTGGGQTSDGGDTA